MDPLARFAAARKAKKEAADGHSHDGWTVVGMRAPDGTEGERGGGDGTARAHHATRPVRAARRGGRRGRERSANERRPGARARTAAGDVGGRNDAEGGTAARQEEDASHVREQKEATAARMREVQQMETSDAEVARQAEDAARERERRRRQRRACSSSYSRRSPTRWRRGRRRTGRACASSRSRISRSPRRGARSASPAPAKSEARAR